LRIYTIALEMRARVEHVVCSAAEHSMVGKIVRTIVIARARFQDRDDELGDNIR
jgi:hypothetical protein